ncbi:transcription initiation factor TFIID subunit 3 [[Emmonsia] crescens]|uniref:pH-response regulator protein palC n=1 Tax=[Emmonsia] crescens TaxID=73230 RepID=A0A2B7ZLA8_9EURO|nr:transcription initiation factor TFIID subunit 3 [Emmonsia crescens]
MVFFFSLPTTSHLSFQSYLSSPTHPSLPQSASTARHALRLALKKHKRLSPTQQSGHLHLILTALNEYIPYLFALSRGLSSDPAPHGAEDIDIHLRSEIEVEWRATLSSSSSLLRLRRGEAGLGRSSRARGRGLDFEIAFVLSTLGYVLANLGRTRYLKTLYANKTPTLELKTAAVQAATKYLLQASSVHAFLASSSSFSGLFAATTPQTSKFHKSTPTSISTSGSLPETATSPIPIPDLDPSTQSALSTLALAEATLLAVVKDDAYLSACIQARNSLDTDWMVKPPDIPKVRTLIFARLCVRAAEYAEQALSSAGAIGGQKSDAKLDEDLLNYMRSLARVCRAKACRFFGIDAEMAGKTGEGIAWLRAGRGVLGFRGALEEDENMEGNGRGKVRGGFGTGFSKLKRGWSERREERRIEKEAASSKGDELEREAEMDWGDDAGREEEGRVIDMLEAKWVKMNDTINTQLIPSSSSYLANLPSGRDIHSTPAAYTPPQLDAEQLMHMRVPPDTHESLDVADSSDEDVDEGEAAGRGYF